MSWQLALERTFDVMYDPARVEGLEWAAVGSVATALQGCRISPHDADIITRKPEAVFRFAEFMSAFAAVKCEAESPEGGPWWSTAETPVYVGPYWDLDWHYACWDVDGFLVSVVHVVAPAGHPAFRDTGGVWECDPQVWPYTWTIRFSGRDVPVMPLEIQLETNMARGWTFSEESLQGRIEEIVRVLKRVGYDRPLLEWALRPEHLAKFDEMVSEV